MKNLQDYIEGLLETHQLLDCFRQTKNFYTVIGVYGSRPLNIERRGNMVVVGQYTSDGDDVLANPEMICQISKRGRWLPVESFFWDGVWINCKDGSWFSNLRESRYMRRLAGRWVQSLANQNFERGKVERLQGENA